VANITCPFVCKEGEMLKDEFLAIESRMKNDLARARARFSHPGDKGTTAEDAFREFLREYLPRRLALGHGEVIDSLENRSAQTDVIIASEDHPFTFTENSPGLFFIEGVVGAGEVKSVLTTSHLAQSIKNSRQFKALKSNLGQGTLICSSQSDLERYYKSPPWFLFAYESQISLRKICDFLKFKSQTESGTAMNLIDAVFVLEKGWIINFGDGKETFQFINPEGVSLTGWRWNQKGFALFQLMAWFSSVMPKTIRFEPILPRYLDIKYVEETCSNREHR
jgi:hypothetical protein